MLRTPAAGLLVAVTLMAATGGPAAAATGGGTVRSYLTTADLRLTLHRQPDTRFGSAAPTAGADVITVQPQVTGQRITAGFGVAMTDTSAWLLATKLSTEKRAEVLRLLFDPHRGIGLTFLRIPIGGSDFIVTDNPYTYDDLPAGQSDPQLTRFSTHHDDGYVFPVLRQVLAQNRGITVMANVWTPPAWMKSDGKLISSGPFGLLPQYYDAYAQYLVKTLLDYRRHGVPVHYLGVQNEPYTPLLIVAGIPSSFQTGPEQGVVIKDHVAPALRAAGLAPKVLAYDDAYQRSETFIPAAMAIAGDDIAGFAYHCYLSDPSAIGVEAQAFPGKEQLETECASKLSNVEPASMTIRTLRAGGQGVQLWNAVLDKRGGPKIGSGCAGIPLTGPDAGVDCIAPVTVDRAKGTYTLSSDFWALAHFSRFIKPGAVRLESTSARCLTTPMPPSPCGVEDVAFQNPDGSRVLVATAHDGAAHRLAVTEDGRTFSALLPDGGTATFVWNVRAPAATVRTTRPSATVRGQLPSTGLPAVVPLLGCAALALAVRRSRRSQLAAA
ncbi:MAG: O-Glycosyl hydrolase 30 family protein [Frankiales bacterium]|nr:O-Glycosyl hydrolase 30 family protein [Frankiales bacterium]